MKISSFLADISSDHLPRKFGSWVSFGQYDPQFPISALKSMAKSGVIELDEDCERFRLTLKALDYFEK